MTLDEFLRTLDGLLDAQVQDDDPGEGNFGCQNCRACYSCRFCVGCDSCEDCTYCEESVDCTSCTQSKRCVACEKVSYCEDCRDCKGSRYLTLCVDCKDCIHCLGCVGLEGAEFYVLNQKRSRKEYFALLRQVQELLRVRYDVGWRPPTIGLSSEVRDPVQAGRDVELTTAPWLDDLFGEASRVREEDVEPAAADWDEPKVRDLDAFAAELEVDDELVMPSRSRGRDELPAREQSQTIPHERGRLPAARHDDPPSREPAPREGVRGREVARSREPERSREPDRSREPERWSGYDDHELPGGPDVVRSHAWEDSREATVARPRSRGPEPRGPEPRGPEPRGPEPRPANPRSSESSSAGRIPRASESSSSGRIPRDSSSGRYPGVAPQGPRPTRGAEPPRSAEPRWDDDELIDDSLLDDRHHDDRHHDDSHGVPEPVAREREPSSPWLDADAQHVASKRSSLRRAGRPERKPDAPIESGTGTYRSGKKPSESLRGEPRDEGTRTGLRTGRRPKPK